MNWRLFVRFSLSGNLPAVSDLKRSPFRAIRSIADAVVGAPAAIRDVARRHYHRALWGRWSGRAAILELYAW